MNRRDAIARASAFDVLDPDAVIFASISATKSVWWMDLPLGKVATDFPHDINLLLFDQRSGELHQLRVPAAYLVENMANLDIRDDKSCISLQLAADPPFKFQNTRPAASGVSFGEFLVRTI